MLAADEWAALATVITSNDNYDGVVTAKVIM